MRRYLMIFLLMVPWINNNLYAAISACTAPTQTVPFENVNLSANCTLPVNYNFGQISMIFCYTSNTPTPASIYWPYQGIILSAPLPVFLTINPIYQGFFADSQGMLTIFNPPGITAQVSCLYGY